LLQRDLGDTQDHLFGQEGLFDPLPNQLRDPLEELLQERLLWLLPPYVNFLPHQLVVAKLWMLL
jgi:hypothetical protein